MEKISSISNKLLNKYKIQIEDFNIYIHSGTFKHIQKRHPEIESPRKVIEEVLKAPDYIGQHPIEKNSIEFVKKIDNNYLVAIKIDKKTTKFIVATTYSISEGKLKKHLESKRLLLSEEFIKTYLVTGGAGFIGANFVKYMLEEYEDIKLVILDKLTYAGNLRTIREELKDSRVSFVKGDICNRELVENIFMQHDIDYIVNFAAESHVDRSIENPQIFLETNILGTQNLMEVAKTFWTIGKDSNGYPIYKEGKKFHHVSTDEVYGSLSKDWEIPRELILDEAVAKIATGRTNLQTYGKKMFTETTPLDPRSPYSASKTASDMIVMAYGETYKFPFNITRCSNNYGPYHFPEKLIPLIIKNILSGKKLPVYGKGDNVRDWLYVMDHCKGIDMVISNAKAHEIYNIGGFNEEQNINIVKLTIDTIARIMKDEPKYQAVLTTDLANINYNLITYVQDRLGHDARYAIDPTKMVTELGWYPETQFTEGLEKTIRWYLDNQRWVEEVASGDYLK